MLEWTPGVDPIGIPPEWLEKFGGQFLYRQTTCPDCGARIAIVAIPPRNTTLPHVFIHGEDYGLVKVAGMGHWCGPMRKGVMFDPVAHFLEEAGNEFWQEYHDPELREKNDDGHWHWYNLWPF